MRCIASAPAARAAHREALLLQAAPDDGAQLPVVLHEQDLAPGHVASIAERATAGASPSRSGRLLLAQDLAEAQAPYAAGRERGREQRRDDRGAGQAGEEAPRGSPARRAADRRRAGGSRRASRDSSQPRPTASARPALSTIAASVHRNAEIRDSGAPIAAIVANSWRRSEMPEGDEQRHRGGRQDDREGLLDVADAGQVDGRDRAARARALVGDVVDLRARARWSRRRRGERRPAG